MWLEKTHFKKEQQSNDFIIVPFRSSIPLSAFEDWQINLRFFKFNAVLCRVAFLCLLLAIEGALVFTRRNPRRKRFPQKNVLISDMLSEIVNYWSRVYFISQLFGSG